jgi:4-hydroxy-3-methylbut-2-enyl diphosphate reductase
MQAPADLLQELLHRRRGTLDDRDAPDVHVGDGTLLVQEGGVDWSEPVEVALGHQRLAYLDAPYNDIVSTSVQKLLLAAPRGYCAGVDRAVQTVERALSIHGAPVYVRKEIVHNKHVVEELRKRGAIFVDQHTEVPEGAVCVFSAHGVAPSVRAGAEERGLHTIDATCPLVTKVHREAVRFARDGYTIVLVGHDGHEEVEGTMGEAPDRIVLVESEEDVDALEVDDPERVAFITQTTLAVDETTAIITRLRARFPSIVGPRTDDICYATTNRQSAVKQMAGSCDLMLVIGSRNSSNSLRLVEVARDCGTDAHLVDNAGEVKEEWLAGRRVVGISSGASAPENLVAELVDLFRARGVSDISEFDVVREDVRFMLPKQIRESAVAGEPR